MGTAVNNPIKFKVTVSSEVQKFQYDKTKDSWPLYREGAAVPSGQPAIEAISILIDNEKEPVNGAVMLNGAATSKCAGQHLAEYLLNNQEKIPEELRSKILVFADTIWFDGSDLRVPCLCWNGDEWCLDSFYLDNDWDSSFMFVRLGA